MTRDRRLHLLRHGKSSWDDESLPDVQRPLAPRGKRAAKLLREHFRAIELSVDLVLCSPARRTRQTWSRVRAGLHGDPEVRYVEAVYEATAAQLLEVVRGVERSVGSLLVVGHNPGLEDLTASLVADGEPEAVARLGEGFATGGFASLSVGSAWAGLDRGGAHLDDFVRPRDLAGG